MADIKLVEHKEKMRKIRPHFLRQDYHHRKKVEDDFWRAPKGRHSKMRDRKRGKRAVVVIGYKMPEEVRGLHRTGAKLVYVANFADLNKIDPKSDMGVLSGKLGDKKRYEILKTAAEKKINFVNIKIAKFIADFETKQKLKAETKPAKTKVDAKPAKEEKKETKPAKKEVTK